MRKATVFLIVLIAAVLLLYGFWKPEKAISGQAVVAGNLSVQGICVLDLSPSNYLQFGSLLPGARSSEATLTIYNNGNVPQNVSVNGTDWFGPGSFTVTRTKYNASAPGADYVLGKISLTNISTIILSNQPGMISNPTYWQVEIPPGQAPGTYNQAIEVTGQC